MNEIIYTIVMTHITMVFATLYLHRGLSHKTLEFKPAFEHFIRFWLWLTDGVHMKEWVATHRKHHRFTDVEGDPHSPVIWGIKKIAFSDFFATSYYRYRNFAPQWQVEAYGVGTPDDWMERNVYVPYQRMGLVLLLLINLLLFGWTGIIVWLIQVFWTPFWSGSIVTGFAHYWGGYHNEKAKDNSKNLPFLGFFLIGDNMHSNHHAEPANPKLSHKWWEFDLGWCYIKLWEKLKLVKIVNRGKYE
jgi:stearoyl-CoA desaturase (delta-9 desaturase)